MFFCLSVNNMRNIPTNVRLQNHFEASKKISSTIRVWQSTILRLSITFFREKRLNLSAMRSDQSTQSTLSFAEPKT